MVKWNKETFYAAAMQLPWSGCWIWMGYVKATPSPNYMLPKTSYGGVTESGARVAWKIYKGLIPKDAHVLHICDNCYCVNPEHLYLGNHAMNMFDMNKRGRGAAKNQKMHKEEVIEAHKLRNSGWKVVDLAKKYEIQPKSMSRILNGGHWGQFQPQRGRENW